MQSLTDKLDAARRLTLCAAVLGAMAFCRNLGAQEATTLDCRQRLGAALNAFLDRSQDASAQAVLEAAICVARQDPGAFIAFWAGERERVVIPARPGREDIRQKLRSSLELLNAAAAMATADFSTAADSLADVLERTVDDRGILLVPWTAWKEELHTRACRLAEVLRHLNDQAVAAVCGSTAQTERGAAVSAELYDLVQEIYADSPTPLGNRPWTDEDIDTWLSDIAGRLNSLGEGITAPANQFWQAVGPEQTIGRVLESFLEASAARLRAPTAEQGPSPYPLPPVVQRRLAGTLFQQWLAAPYGAAQGPLAGLLAEAPEEATLQCYRLLFSSVGEIDLWRSRKVFPPPEITAHLAALQSELGGGCDMPGRPTGRYAGAVLDFQIAFQAWRQDEGTAPATQARWYGRDDDAPMLSLQAERAVTAPAELRRAVENLAAVQDVPGLDPVLGRGARFCLLHYRLALARRRQSSSSQTWANLLSEAQALYDDAARDVGAWDQLNCLDTGYQGLIAAAADEWAAFHGRQLTWRRNDVEAALAANESARAEQTLRSYQDYRAGLDADNRAADEENHRAFIAAIVPRLLRLYERQGQAAAALRLAAEFEDMKALSDPDALYQALQQALGDYHALLDSSLALYEIADALNAQDAGGDLLDQLRLRHEAIRRFAGAEDRMIADSLTAGRPDPVSEIVTRRAKDEACSEPLCQLARLLKLEGADSARAVLALVEHYGLATAAAPAVPGLEPLSLPTYDGLTAAALEALLAEGAGLDDLTAVRDFLAAPNTPLGAAQRDDYRYRCYRRLQELRIAAMAAAADPFRALGDRRYHTDPEWAGAGRVALPAEANLIAAARTLAQFESLAAERLLELPREAAARRAADLARRYGADADDFAAWLEVIAELRADTGDNFWFRAYRQLAARAAPDHELILRQQSAAAYDPATAPPELALQYALVCYEIAAQTETAADWDEAITALERGGAALETPADDFLVLGAVAVIRRHWSQAATSRELDSRAAEWFGGLSEAVYGEWLDSRNSAGLAAGSADRLTLLRTLHSLGGDRDDAGAAEKLTRLAELAAEAEATARPLARLIRGEPQMAAQLYAAAVVNMPSPTGVQLRRAAEELVGQADGEARERFLALPPWLREPAAQAVYDAARWPAARDIHRYLIEQGADGEGLAPQEVEWLRRAAEGHIRAGLAYADLPDDLGARLADFCRGLPERVFAAAWSVPADAGRWAAALRMLGVAGVENVGLSEPQQRLSEHYAALVFDGLLGPERESQPLASIAARQLGVGGGQVDNTMRLARQRLRGGAAGGYVSLWSVVCFGAGIQDEDWFVADEAWPGPLWRWFLASDAGDVAERLAGWQAAADVSARDVAAETWLAAYARAQRDGDGEVADQRLRHALETFALGNPEYSIALIIAQNR